MVRDCARADGLAPVDVEPTGIAPGWARGPAGWPPAGVTTPIVGLARPVGFTVDVIRAARPSGIGCVVGGS